MKKIPGIIQGGQHVDARGKLTFFNDFDMGAVKRFYVIEHPDTETVRAWQAHKTEQKWFHVIAGSFKRRRWRWRWSWPLLSQLESRRRGSGEPAPPFFFVLLVGSRSTLKRTGLHPDHS